MNYHLFAVLTIQCVIVSKLDRRRLFGHRRVVRNVIINKTSHLLVNKELVALCKLPLHCLLCGTGLVNIGAVIF